MGRNTSEIARSRGRRNVLDDYANDGAYFHKMSYAVNWQQLVDITDDFEETLPQIFQRNSEEDMPEGRPDAPSQKRSNTDEKILLIYAKVLFQSMPL